MLWAQFQPKNEAEAAGFFVGVMLAGLFSGGIPFFTGLVMRQVALGISGGIISAMAGRSQAAAWASRWPLYLQ